MRRAAGGALVLAASLLGACGTLPGRPGSPQPPATSVPPASGPPPAAPVPAPPRDLASIPDAVPRAEPRSRYGNPPSYVVFGRRYHVQASAEGHLERGMASWYGPGFHGARTSSGEPYDMYAMTAAHKTLPIPAYARVTNLNNGRSVVVRINDRGPFVGGRIIDLSYTAAWKLDMLRAGTAPVEVRVLSPVADAPATMTAAAAASPLPPLAATTGTAAAIAAASGPRTTLQAGAFFVESNARARLAQLAAAGIGNAVLRSIQSGGRTIWQVRVGPLDDASEVDAMLERLRLAGVADARRIVD